MKRKWLSAFTLLLFLVCLICGCGETEEPSKTPEDNTPDAPPATVAGIVLEKETLTLTVGDEYTLTAGGEGYYNLSWKTDNAAVLSLEENENQAVLTAKVPGTATVTAFATSTSGAEIKATCTVTVQKSPINVNLPEGKLVLKRGRSATVKAFVAEGFTGDITWESSDTSIATVEYQGLIAVVTSSSTKSGSCTITVHCGDAKSSFEFICGLS